MPLRLDIITPERNVLTETVDSVNVPGANGELGILPGHTPLISQLQTGILAYSQGGTTRRLLVSGGFVEVRDDRVAVLADLAERPEEIDAALRALEIKAEVILKATKVEGIYNADPMKDTTATRYDCITYQEVLEQRLQVMDASAISLCMDNRLPIVVFNMRKPGNIMRVVMGEVGVGTTVCMERTTS